MIVPSDVLIGPISLFTIIPHYEWMISQMEQIPPLGTPRIIMRLLRFQN